MIKNLSWVMGVVVLGIMFFPALAQEPTACPTEARFPKLVGLFAPGMRSEQVKLLQEMLASDPAITPQVEINGHYDELTIAAVQSFQSQHGILSSGSPETNAYGWAGPRTRAAMNKLYGGGQPPDCQLPPAPVSEPEPVPEPAPEAPPAPSAVTPATPLAQDWSLMGVVRTVATLLRP
ncbi:MAG: peptidoglycan-binding domain-containing protein [Patescibacteria group bacterium]